nr:hypothetical protein [uncultured Roseibium sp.]
MTVPPSANASDTLLRVVICGSMSAIDEIERLAATLRQDGFIATTPAREESGLDWNTLSETEAVSRKQTFLNDYFDVIRDCDLVLIANYAKHDVGGYIGANALMEAACAHALRKPVYFLNPIGDQPCALEARAVASGILEGNARLLKALVNRTS